MRWLCLLRCFESGMRIIAGCRWFGDQRQSNFPIDDNQNSRRNDNDN
jgi:hypothetical protein